VRNTFNKKTIFEFDFRDFDQYVQDEYGRPYDVTSSNLYDGYANDSYHKYSVDGDPEWWNADEARSTIEKWLLTPVPDTSEYLDPHQARMAAMRFTAISPPVAHMLWDLCRQGKIEAGEYLMNVSW